MHDVDLSRPVLVLGSPRSGTTLLRLLLTCHPAIVIPPECGFQLWLAPHFPPDQAPDLDRFVSLVTTARKFETWGLEPAALRSFLESRAPRTFAEAAAWVSVFYGIHRGRQARRWGDKTNFHVRHVPQLRALWPRAQFVHIVRDGRDVATSYLRLQAQTSTSPYRPQLPGEVAAIAARWREDVLAVTTALSECSVDQGIQVRYEDLVQDPPAVLTRVCAFLGEAYTPEMLAYAERNQKEALEPPAFLEWKELTTRAPTVESVGRWRRELTPEQVAVVEAVAGPTLRELNYPEQQ